MKSIPTGKTVIFTLILLTLMQFGALNELNAQGESAVPFLLIAPNARADGMGEAGAALSDDGSAAYWNPGGLAFEKGQEVSITHSNWLPQFQLSDLFYEYFAYRNNIEAIRGTISASVIYLNLGEFNRRDEFNNDLGNFKAFEFAITGGYATKITNDLGIGINLRYIHSSLDPSESQDQPGRKGVASTVSFDIGTLWHPSRLVLPGIGESFKPWTKINIYPGSTGGPVANKSTPRISHQTTENRL